jgi:short-subunit dehydrogenase
LYYELLPLGIRVVIVQPGSTHTQIAKPYDSPLHSSLDEYEPICSEVVHGFRHRYETESIASPASPEGPAKDIYKAAISKSNRYRYVSGRDAKAMNFMLRLFPEHTIKRIACRMFGLKVMMPSTGSG